MFRGHVGNALLWASLSGAAMAVAQQPATPAPAADAAKQPKITHTETVVVTAPGEIRDEQSVELSTLIEEMPGTSPVKTLAALPSVNFQAADPYGSYEWAVRISVRGFNQNQLGFTLDEIPLGDMSYGNWNGLHISRAITDENIGRLTLSQGTGALETASNSNLGGTVQFFSDDPHDKRGFNVQQSFGSFNAARTFARFDSGAIGHGKFFVTGAYNLANKWRGAGDIGQNYWQINGKYVHYLGNKGIFTVYADISDRKEVDYQDVSKVWVQKLGYNWDNFGNWAQAVQAGYGTEAAYYSTGGNTCGTAGVSASAYGFTGAVGKLDAGDDPCDAAYYGGSGLRKDKIGYVSYKQGFGDHWTFKLTGYGHRNDGRGLWFTPYNPTYDNYFSPTTIVSPISLRTSEYGIARGGALTSAAYETSKNKFEFGMWFEGEEWDLARRFYATSATSAMHSLYDFPHSPYKTSWSYVFNSLVYDFHAQDIFKVTNKLTVAAGFKVEETTTDGNLASDFKSSAFYTAGTYAQGKLTSGKPFLPQVGANYKINAQNEIFGDAAYNVRSYVPGGYGFGNSPWGTTQTNFDALKSSLKPETSWTEEAGYRYTGKMAQVQTSFFHVNFYDRLLAFANGSGIQGSASTLNNTPGATTNGIDGSVNVRLGSNVTVYNALTWNRSTIDGDPKNADGTCHYTLADGSCDSIQGKLVVDTPEFLYKTGLDYKKSGFFAHLGADYMSERYFTYSNDGSVAGRFITEVGTGYGRSELGAFKDLKAQLNVSNLTNSQYWASIGTNGFSFHDPLAVGNNTLQVGAPRSISGSLSVRF